MIKCTEITPSQTPTRLERWYTFMHFFIPFNIFDLLYFLPKFFVFSTVRKSYPSEILCKNDISCTKKKSADRFMFECKSLMVSGIFTRKFSLIVCGFLLTFFLLAPLYPDHVYVMPFFHLPPL